MMLRFGSFSYDPYIKFSVNCVCLFGSLCVYVYFSSMQDVVFRYGKSVDKVVRCIKD